MAVPKLKTVTRTQGNNQALKDGTVKPRTFAFDFEEVDPLIAAFRRMVRGNEFDICEMAITTYICAKEHGKPMTAIPASGNVVHLQTLHAATSTPTIPAQTHMVPLPCFHCVEVLCAVWSRSG